MRAIRCPRGSSSARADLIEITSPAPGGAQRPGYTALTAQCMFRAGGADRDQALGVDNPGGVSSKSRRQLGPWN